MTDAIYRLFAERQSAIPARNIQIWNKDIEAGILAGKLPIAPFIIINYAGFKSEGQGNNCKRLFTVPLLIGISGLRGEQAAFKGDGVEVTTQTVDAVLEELENVVLDANLGDYDDTLAGVSGIDISEETYMGSKNSVEVWGWNLEFEANFAKE